MSIRDWVRIGTVLGPAERHPVAVEAFPGGDFQLGQPLGRRHVAVQAGDDQAGRIAMARRQRLVVHLDRDHRLPRRVHDPGHGHPGRPAIHAAPDQLGRVRLDPGQLQDIAQPDTGPLGVADQAATDLVADARDGHVLLEQGQAHELGEGQRRLAVDQAVDAQGPRGGIHVGHEQRGIDAVELVVGDDQRGQAGDRGGQVLLRRRGTDRLRGGRDGRVDRSVPVRSVRPPAGSGR